MKPYVVTLFGLEEYRFALRKIPVRKTLLPATKFENLQEYGCVICSSELNRSTVSCLYPCLHRFCYNCILKWLKVKSSCPLCLVTPTKLLYSIQSSSLFKETKLQHEFPNGDLRREGNHMRRLEEADIIPESQDTNEAYQQTLRGSRRQQELIVQREERLKLARQCKVEKC